MIKYSGMRRNAQVADDRRPSQGENFLLSDTGFDK